MGWRKQVFSLNFIQTILSKLVSINSKLLCQIFFFLPFPLKCMCSVYFSLFPHFFLPFSFSVSLPLPLSLFYTSIFFGDKLELLINWLQFNFNLFAFSSPLFFFRTTHWVQLMRQAHLSILQLELLIVIIIKRIDQTSMNCLINLPQIQTHIIKAHLMMSRTKTVFHPCTFNLPKVNTLLNSYWFFYYFLSCFCFGFLHLL